MKRFGICFGTVWRYSNVSALLTRYILYRVELVKATDYDTVKGPLRFGEHLTLEHVMPIKWRQYWPLPDPQNSRDWRMKEIGQN